MAQLIVNIDDVLCVLVLLLRPEEKWKFKNFVWAINFFNQR